MSNLHSETLELLKWAKKASKESQKDIDQRGDIDETTAAQLATRVAYGEVAHTFWEELCKAVDEPETASAETIYNEICAYGGNTIANIFRGGGVPYPEVAYC